MKQAKRGRWKMAAILVVALLLFGARVDAQGTAAGSSATSEYREIKDEMGRTVRVPLSVKRVVSLAPSVTETIYALGLQDMLVGDTDFCDYPADAQKKTKVGGTINPSIEQIVALKPDLVLATKSSNRLETVLALERLGIAVYSSDPKNVNEVVAATQKLSDLLGATESGYALTGELEKRLGDLQKRLAGLPARHVLFVVWPEPLISIGKKTFVADALLRAGAVSIVETDQDWPQVSLEEVVHLQPEFLVFAPEHTDPATNQSDILATKPGWQGLAAIKNRHFVNVSDAVIRPAPRIVTAIEDMAHQLHPEAFIEKSTVDKPEKLETTPPHSNSSDLFSHFVAAQQSVSIEKERACAL